MSSATIIDFSDDISIIDNFYLSVTVVIREQNYFDGYDATKNQIILINIYKHTVCILKKLIRVYVYFHCILLLNSI